MTYKAQADESIWTEFAGNSCRLPSSSLPLEECISGKTLLVTGAGGSIGSAVAHFAITCDVKALILLDSNEQSLYALEQSLNLSSKAVRVPVLGSICDSVLLSELFALYHPQIVLHAAACKHVPLMELNPIAATSTNVLGTCALLQAASAYGTAQFVMVSTDKAVLPISIMGATKRLAELLLLTHPNRAMQRKAVRLGNVLGSSGSVGPLFLEQITEGGPVTVTHRDARRFFVTLNHAVTLLMTALSAEYETGILIPDLGPARTVEELARYLIAATAGGQQGIEIVFTGLRPGDKVEELLAFPYEGCPVQGRDLFSTVKLEGLATASFYAVLEQIKTSVRERDLGLLLESICKAVPEYRPSRTLQQVVGNKRQAELCK
jgi:FlaA1/EpsC-like NDP-sugar epimerase